MLRSTDRDYVEEKITAVLALSGAPRQAIAALLPPALRQRIAEGLEPAVLAHRAIELCLEDAYNSAPPTLIVLVHTLVGTDSRVASILQLAAIPPPVAIDPFDALILANKLPFLARSQLRGHARRLAGPARVRPLIVVTGNSKSGKTYSGDFLEHICSTRPGLRCSRNELKPKQGRATGAAELARDLMTDVGGRPSDLPPRQTNADGSDTSNLDRWTLELANAVIAQANIGDDRWWFVLDGYNNAELREDTKFFIVNLAMRLQSGVQADRHRLILIDFDRSLLAVKPGLIAPDITEPIPHQQVKVFVRGMTATRATPLDADQLSAEVLLGLPDPIEDLTLLGERLGNLFLAIEGAL
jgi:hypothetical protein